VDEWRQIRNRLANQRVEGGDFGLAGVFQLGDVFFGSRDLELAFHDFIA